MPRLLYVSPVFPSLTGNGLAMRAGMIMRALATRYHVSLLVVPIYDLPQRPLPEPLAVLCERQAVVPISPPEPTASRPGLFARLFAERLPKQRATPPRPVAWQRATPETVQAAAQAYRSVDFEVVHVFRLYMTPYALPYLVRAGRRSPRSHLDLDDIESATRRRLAELCELRDAHERALFEATEADRYESVERELLPRFDRVYVCSETDRAELVRRYRCREVRVIPNAVTVPPPPPPRAPGGPFTFLFVGTLGYFPNEDALLYLFDEVVPLLRTKTSREFRVLIVGTGGRPAVQELGERPDARLVGPVPDVAPYYAAADAVVVPIRAGGGTRIKVLEAFSYRRPVVSTSIGIEGIEARNGEHVLLGDTPEAFADACARVIAQADLAAALAENAFALLTRLYTVEVISKSLAALDRQQPPTGSRSGAGRRAPR